LLRYFPFFIVFRFSLFQPSAACADILHYSITPLSHSRFIYFLSDAFADIVSAYFLIISCRLRRFFVYAS